MGTEEKLLHDIKNGKREAQRSLYDRYSGIAMSVCLRYMGNEEDARDVLQDAFIKIFTRIGDIKFQGEGTLKGWILKVTANEALNTLRRRVIFSDTDNLPDLPEEESPDVENVPLEVLMQIIGSLPTGYRTVFNMFVIEQNSHKEIASQLGIKVSSSASQLLRAKKILANMINEYVKTK